jgi:hypothetical protein
LSAIPALLSAILVLSSAISGLFESYFGRCCVYIYAHGHFSMHIPIPVPVPGNRCKDGARG